MCGNHHADGSPVDHHHPEMPVFMPQVRGPRQLRRRAFLGEVGKGTMAFAVFAPAFVAACSDDGGSTSPGTTSSSSASSTSSPPTTSEQPPITTGTRPEFPLQWARANLGFVSTYVLAWGTEAAIVDTGVEGSADDIGETLAGIGLDYSNVNHVFPTHLHGDHIGSINEVMAMADGATAYAGEADIASMGYGPITAADDGAEIFGLEVIATPGHTAGHIAVIDHDAGLLVAGDAVVTDGGGVSGPVERFASDFDQANDSVGRLAELSFNTLLVGHGDPIEDMADTPVAALAAAI
ncbi:MAG: MBL fold metallo-hydrolase [Acidimicrobiales bacterium]|jgi:glyoxylase-like metal-dependent hydrolase (beta-lactamase superfamily II)|nr:MBL fold metallo-hydrolase [Acidimicrobiales bacterium]